MHIFVVYCRFNELIIDVDFLHKTIVDCGQNGQTNCDLHLVMTAFIISFAWLKNHIDVLQLLWGGVLLN